MQDSEIQFPFFSVVSQKCPLKMLHQITPDKGGYMVDVSESSGLKSLAVKAVEVQEGRD